MNFIISELFIRFFWLFGEPSWLNEILANSKTLTKRSVTKTNVIGTEVV